MGRKQSNSEMNTAPVRPPRCIINDVTPEKVAEILSRDSSGSLMVHDELAGWIGSFERYSSSASSRAFFLQSWNGGTFFKDRVGGGKRDRDAEIRVDNLALSILGGIQPDRLGSLGDLTSDGLLQRGLPVLMRCAERGDEYHPVAEAEAKYEGLIKSINQTLPEKYHFADDALEVRDRVNDYLHELEKVDGFPSALIGAIGKLKGYFPRICLVLQVAWQHDPMSGKEPLLASFTSADRERINKLMVLYQLDPTESLSAGLNSSTPISRRTAEAAEKVLRQFLLPHIFGLYDVVVNGGQDRTCFAPSATSSSHPRKTACASPTLRRGSALLGANPSKRSGNVRGVSALWAGSSPRRKGPAFPPKPGWSCPGYANILRNGAGRPRPRGQRHMRS